jgi:O-antigen/teichoic acid export membrane protein
VVRFELRRLGLFGDVLASGALVGVASALNVASVFLFAHAMEPAAFGLLSTCRRVVAFLAPFAGLNGHLAVSRYLGYHAAEPRRRSAFFMLGVMLIVATVPLALGIFCLMRAFGSHVAWIGDLDASVWVGTAVLTAATAGALFVFSILRGLGHPQAANLQQLFLVAAMLGIAFVAREQSVTALLYLAAVATVLVSVADLVWVAAHHRHEWTWPTRQELTAGLGAIARYSLPRVADGPCQASLPLIGVLLAPAVGGLALAGSMHISQTMVRMTEVAIVPLSVIFLPLAARQVRDGQFATLERQAQLIYDSVFLIGACLVAQSLAWSGTLLRAAFGLKYAGATTLVLVTLPAILPYLLFAGFRSFLDGYSEKPVNFMHLLVATGIVVVLSPPLGRLFGGPGLALGYTASVLVLGWLTIRYVRRKLRVKVMTTHAAGVTVSAAVLGLASFAMARLVDGRNIVLVGATFVGCQLLVLTLEIAVMRKRRHPAVAYAEERLGRLWAPPKVDTPSPQPTAAPGHSHAVRVEEHAGEPVDLGARNS